MRLASRLPATWFAVILLVVGAGAAVILPAAADACEVPAAFTPRARVEHSGVIVVYRTVPPTIEVGKHFSLDALVCAETGTPVLERVDATMPEHRHGMNYRATVGAKGPGRYVAEGLMFHMPGLWQLVFDVERAGQRTRLTSDLELQ
jgi:hypothetical protein